MPYVLVQHKVKDYEKWRPLFDEHGATRKASGSKGGMVFRNAKHKNEVAILLEWDNLANARKFYASEDLKKVMEEAGVSGKPDISFLKRASRARD